MKELKWYYPKTLADAGMQVQQKNVLPHGGGTGLLLRKLAAVDGLIELSQLPLRSVKVVNNSIEIGSMCTYADVVAELTKIDADHMLVKCLNHSANTPLRNRITIGGSIAMFPPWSDLVGALLALEAKVRLIGEKNGDFSITEYVKNKSLRNNTLITAVILQNSHWRSAHYREIRTKSDMPQFNHTVLLNLEAGQIMDSRIITVGTTARFTRLHAVEDYLNSRKPGDINLNEISALVNLKFIDNRFDDPDYTNIKAGIELARLIEKLVRS
jgi:CO/xanthine dehydrogenase FAD-binding subunit